MTCREKLAMEHPDYEKDMVDGEPVYCPEYYGYLEDPDCCGDDNWSCRSCWNREIPREKETTTYILDKNDKIEPDPMWPKENPYIAKADKDMEDAFSKMKEEARKICENVVTAVEQITNPHILDSGHRREFETGAVRDICEGKGRCDLMPLDVVAAYLHEDNQSIDWVLAHIANFQKHGQEHYLFSSLLGFRQNRGWDDHTMLLEVAKHFEEGCKKYGDNNWQKGIPARCYVDSAVRHYLKFLRGDEDEPHDRAFCWNILCCIWTCKHKPELNDYAKGDKNAEKN